MEMVAIAVVGISMKITKFGHCCLLIEEKGVRIITDPGIFSSAQNEVEDIHLILITHEHPDHFHIDSVKEIIKHNPKAQVITNASVGALLAKEGLAFSTLEDGQFIERHGVLLEAHGNTHALLHTSLSPVQNTGYCIANKLFYPGDAFTNPGEQIEILALPVAGPWLKLSEAVDYALELKPKLCFPVHEGALQNPGTVHSIPPQILEPQGIQFTVLEIGKEVEV